MQQLFSRANEALHRDLAEYAETLRVIVATVPRARALCEQAIREARLVQALLAFGSGPQVVELGQIAFHLCNLWAAREELRARTAGFDDEINEARAGRDMARRGMQLLGSRDDDGLSSELRLCLTNITTYLDQQQRLLEECQIRLRPFTANPDLTRKRLNLLVAAAEARLPDTPERSTAVRTYSEAASLLQEWEGGVPLDERGIAILERCIDIINQSSALFGILSVPAIIPSDIAPHQQVIG